MIAVKMFSFMITVLHLQTSCTTNITYSFMFQSLKQGPVYLPSLYLQMYPLTLSSVHGMSFSRPISSSWVSTTVQSSFLSKSSGCPILQWLLIQYAQFKFLQNHSDWHEYLHSKSLCMRKSTLKIPVIWLCDMAI